ncbi:hypothetical protein ERO13_D03G027250v2 [Gossypium hirsutum]|nr:hypothetical protein ERO13_D03G027250v2 [Gossypium hirsutum]
MAHFITFLLVLSLSLTFSLLPETASAQLRQNYYAKPKFRQTFVTVPATIRLFFHDCFVQGCDASVIIQSTGSNKAEKDHPDNLSLAGDGFDTVIKAKQAVDAVPSCRNKVSCADILAMATRDVIALSGGPSYAVELGRLDGLSSTAASVNGKLPHPDFNLNQLNSMFAAHGLTQTDMIALSAAHTVGFSHCSKFSNRIYNFSRQSAVDPTLNRAYATQLQQMCPKNNLQQGKGLFTSDQVLFTDKRSKPVVNAWAANSNTFNSAFITAITKLGRVGVKTGRNGNIRRNCDALN